MENTFKEELDYSEVRKIMNEYYASLGRKVKVRIVHQKTPKGKVFVKLEGVEWKTITYITLIEGFDISRKKFVEIMKDALEDDTKEIVSIIDKAQVSNNCVVYFDGQIDKDCITNKKFTIGYQEKEKAKLIVR